MIEDKIWSEDPTKYIIGADEVGRGSFAGPICAAAVKINYSHLELLTNVKDSKKCRFGYSDVVRVPTCIILY